MKKLLFATTALAVAMTTVSPAFASSFDYNYRLANHEQRLAEGRWSGYDIAGDGWETCIPGVCYIGEDTLPAGTLKPVVLNAQALLLASKQQPNSVLVASTDNSFVYIKSPFIAELAAQNKVDYERMADIMWSGPKSWSETMQEETAKLQMIANIVAPKDNPNKPTIDALQSIIDGHEATIADLQAQLAEKPTEVIVEVIKEVMVEVEVEIIKEVVKEVLVEVPVETIVEVEVIKEVIKEVMVEVIKEVEVPGETVYVDVPGETVYVDVVETIYEDTAATTALVESLQGQVSTLNTTIEGLNAKISEDATTITNLSTDVAFYKDIADGLDAAVEEARTAGFNEGVASVTKDSSQGLSYDGEMYITMTLTNGETVSGNIEPFVKAAFEEGHTAGYNLALQEFNAAGENLGTSTGGSSKVLEAGSEYLYNPKYHETVGSSDSLAIAITADFSVGLNPEELAELLFEVEEALETAYNDGYDDGYNDGYQDGYADGVASVSTTTD